MTALETWVDGAVGETRRAMVRDGRPVMLHVARWSDAGRRALWGEVYAARVRTIDRRLRGAFLDLGLGDAQGFVRLDAQARARTTSGPVALVEGQAVRALVRREGVNGKSAVLEVLGPIDGAVSVGRLEHAEGEPAPAADHATRASIDAAVEAALAPEAPIPGGGQLFIERTRALVAVDVDAGARPGGRDAEQFALSLNTQAAAEAARQLRVRGLGGIVAVDFVSLRDARHRASVVAALKAAVADDPWGVIVAPMSRFGVVEMSRGQLRAPLADVMCEANGALSAETIALAGLRGLEREMRMARGRFLWLTVSPPVFSWLQRDLIGWRAALTARIGAHWDVRPDPALTSWRVEAA
ncbi:MAG: ribonuclease E/G [Hyphomonadaceae bacterium]|nr:ribonuclease E/G [Hyphomonadaceae bacterium]